MERDGPSALETTLPFDERQVLEENRAYLCKALEVCVELGKGQFWLNQFCFWCCFHNLKRNAPSSSPPTPNILYLNLSKINKEFLKIDCSKNFNLMEAFSYRMNSGQ